MHSPEYLARRIQSWLEYSGTSLVTAAWHAGVSWNAASNVLNGRGQVRTLTALCQLVPEDYVLPPPPPRKSRKVAAEARHQAR